MYSPELLVILQLDVINRKPKITCDSGQLYGNDSNRDIQQANRIQTIMISSILSPNKDVVSLVPVQKMTAQDMYTYTITLEVIKTIVTTGYRIMAIISDNNIINRKKKSDALYCEPSYKIDRIYILFDTVHLYQE